MKELLVVAVFGMVVTEHKSLADHHHPNNLEELKKYFNPESGIHPGFDFMDTKIYKDVVGEEWELWKSKHGKSYSPEEDVFRMKIFMDNKYRIAKHNIGHQLGHHDFTMEMNNLGDLLPHEIKMHRNGYRPQLRLNGTGLLVSKTLNKLSYIPPANVELPKSIDWRPLGAVTAVKNQGNCGSCWAFACTGALEGQNFRKTGQLIPLSEQNLVDCSGAYGNKGCGGGLPDFAFKYIKENNGIDTEVSYPYEGINDVCRYSKKNRGATDIGFVDLPVADEEALKAAVATVGPVAAAIDAAQYSFQFYRGGVYYDHRCTDYDLDHAVLVVGYDTDEKGQDYWLVKNSWGVDWGTQGYIKMARNRENHCGIATAASYPQV